MRYASLRQGLVGCWCPSVSGPFGYRLPDLSGYGNHGTLTNMDPGSDWVVSGGKGALDFDGSNDKVACADLGCGTTHTAALWINTGSANRVVFGGNVGFYFLYFESTTIYYSAVLGNFVSVSYSIPNSWTHYCVSRIDTKVNFFANGTKVGATQTLSANNNFSFNTIGGYSSLSSVFLGQLDDIRIYNRALTEQEIRLLASERGIGLKPERQRNRYPAPALPSRNRSSRFLGFPA